MNSQATTIGTPSLYAVFICPHSKPRRYHRALSLFSGQGKPSAHTSLFPVLAVRAGHARACICHIVRIAFTVLLQMSLLGRLRRPSARHGESLLQHVRAAVISTRSPFASLPPTPIPREPTHPTYPPEVMSENYGPGPSRACVGHGRPLLWPEAASHACRLSNSGGTSAMLNLAVRVAAGCATTIRADRAPSKP